MNKKQPGLQSDETSLNYQILMVAGCWEIGVYIAIHNQTCSITIWAILATKIHGKHSQQLNQNPFEFRHDETRVKQ